METHTNTTVLITGAAGYVGEMLVEQFAARADVGCVIGIDRKQIPLSLAKQKKLLYLQYDLACDGWQPWVAAYAPTVVVHAAWQIRSLYGWHRIDPLVCDSAEYAQLATAAGGAAHPTLWKRTGLVPARLEQWRMNMGAAEKVFAFACETPSVARLVHFSTAAGYGARPENTLDTFLRENQYGAPDEYRYAYEKQAAERMLYTYFKHAEKNGLPVPAVTVLRPSAITGPRGKYGRIRFGLQSALGGTLRGGVLAGVVRVLTACMPAPKNFARQFIHEDDVCDVVLHAAFGKVSEPYAVYNLTPQGPIVRARELAAMVGKRALPLPDGLVRFAFFIMWHLTLGRIPVAPGSWRFYCYPIMMSGDKLAEVYRCAYTSPEAFAYTDGRYEHEVPEQLRIHRGSV